MNTQESRTTKFRQYHVPVHTSIDIYHGGRDTMKYYIISLREPSPGGASIHRYRLRNLEPLMRPSVPAGGWVSRWRAEERRSCLYFLKIQRGWVWYRCPWAWIGLLNSLPRLALSPFIFTLCELLRFFFSFLFLSSSSSSLNTGNHLFAIVTDISVVSSIFAAVLCTPLRIVMQ